MNKKSKLLWVSLTLALALSLTACGENNNQPSNNNAANNAVEEPAGSGSANDTSESSENNNSGDNSQDAENSDSAVNDELPESKVIKLTLEGTQEEKEAKLFQADGYAIYVFDIFNFDSATNVLSMDFDENYNVEITKLPADYSLAELQADAEEELSKLAEVQGYEGEERGEYMKDASLFLFSRSDDLTKRVIVKEIDGQGYLFKMNIPIGEASEGFPPHAYASLNSIVNQ